MIKTIKKIILTGLIMTFTNLIMAEKPTMYYVFDPLCGWCYGFTPVMIEFKKNHADQYHFKIISGGMVVGSRVHPITEMTDYISSAHKRVEQYTGVKFGEKFLEETLHDSTVILDSELPTRAILAFQDMQPEHVFEFAHDIQKALYYHGMNLSEKSTYGPLVTKYGVEADYFIARLKDEKYRQEAYNQFELAGNLGVTGYPSVIVERDKSREKVASGFVPYNELVKIMEMTE
ncbi:MAG: DsbA family protein [Bacteroidetes bacterium]|jgi:putative protein-disulfide isomerase|nr:DsbA family protein [Bacteroidota bacterium]